MDYEKKYKEAIERAKKWYNAPNSDKMPTYANRVIEEIFPELCESEDEEELTDFEKSLKHIMEETLECGDIHNLKADADLLLRLVKPTDEDMKEALRTEYEKGRADAFAQMQKEWSEEDFKNYIKGE